jgi:hypothetical protein
VRKPFSPNTIGFAKSDRVETGLGIDIPESSYDRLPERFEDEAMKQGVVFRCLVIVGQKPV